MTERDKIVAWLRREADEIEARSYDLIEAEGSIMRQCASFCHGVANRVENLDHLKRPEPTIPFEEWKDKPSVGHG